MTPPLCVVCHAGECRPVAPNNRTQPRRGWRVVDGRRFNWTCSKVCQATDASSRVDPRHIHNGHRAWRQRCARARLRAAVRRLKGYADAHGRVSILVAARVAAEYERAGEHRGSARERQRRLRSTAA